ncbi:hypothetical protein D3C86_1801010 [compost metagenome]
MVGHAHHLDAGALQVLLDCQDLVDGIDFHGEVMKPAGHIFGHFGAAPVLDVEESNVRAVAKFEKKMAERIVGAGGRYLVGANHVRQR